MCISDGVNLLAMWMRLCVGCGVGCLCIRDGVNVLAVWHCTHSALASATQVLGLQPHATMPNSIV